MPCGRAVVESAHNNGDIIDMCFEHIPQILQEYIEAPDHNEEEVSEYLFNYIIHNDRPDLLRRFVGMITQEDAIVKVFDEDRARMWHMHDNVFRVAMHNGSERDIPVPQPAILPFKKTFT